MRFRFVHVSLAVLLIAAGGCGQKTRRAPAIGEAYIGPISVDVREEIPTTSKVIATAHHGDRVDIIQTRRRFIKVRLPNGKEGWTDTMKLLSSEQMQQLSNLAEYAAKIPSMGRAAVFDNLNMHGEPNRYSVSFYQLATGVPVEVLVRRVSERTPPPAVEPIVKRPPPVPKKKPAKEKKQPKVPPPPMPPAPGLPSNWMELSKTNADAALKREQEEKDDEPAAPKKYDDWTLVRTKDGKAGWVLSRMLIMGIPDEVAQYSEGARITAYFPLGEVEDSEAGVRKKHWLWTTIRNTTDNYDFDSFRVFIWNARRHRYETSYIERNLVGFHPVRVEGPKFTVLLKADNGSYYTKTFQLEGYITRWLGNAPAAPPKDPLAGLEGPGGGQPAPDNPQPIAQKSTKDKLKDWWKGLFGKKG